MIFSKTKGVKYAYSCRKCNERLRSDKVFKQKRALLYHFYAFLGQNQLKNAYFCALKLKKRRFYELLYTSRH